MNQINGFLWYFYDVIMIDEYNQRKMSGWNIDATVQNRYIEFLKVHLHLQLHYFHLRNNNRMNLHWSFKILWKSLKPEIMKYQNLYFFVMSQVFSFTTAMWNILPSWSTDVTLFLRPSVDRIWNPFLPLQSKVCPDGYDDGGCNDCDSCFYLNLYTDSDGKTYSEVEVSIVHVMKRIKIKADEAHNMI